MNRLRGGSMRSHDTTYTCIAVGTMDALAKELEAAVEMIACHRIFVQCQPSQNAIGAIESPDVEAKTLRQKMIDTLSTRSRALLLIGVEAAQEADREEPEHEDSNGTETDNSSVSYYLQDEDGSGEFNYDSGLSFVDNQLEPHRLSFRKMMTNEFEQFKLAQSASLSDFLESCHDCDDNDGDLAAIDSPRWFASLSEGKHSQHLDSSHVPRNHLMALRHAHNIYLILKRHRKELETYMLLARTKRIEMDQDEQNTRRKSGFWGKLLQTSSSSQVQSGIKTKAASLEKNDVIISAMLDETETTRLKIRRRIDSILQCPDEELHSQPTNVLEECGIVRESADTRKPFFSQNLPRIPLTVHQRVSIPYLPRKPVGNDSY